MDETVISEIDTYVGKSPLQRVVENKVAGLQIFLFDLYANTTDLFRRPGQGYAPGLPEDVMHQAAAVEPLFRDMTAELVANANQADRLHHQLRCTGSELFQMRGRAALFGCRCRHSLVGMRGASSAKYDRCSGYPLNDDPEFSHLKYFIFVNRAVVQESAVVKTRPSVGKRRHAADYGAIFSMVFVK